MMSSRAITLLGFVSEPVHNFRCDRLRPSLLRQQRHAITFARRAIARRQRTTGQLGQNTPGSSSTPRRELLGTLQHVLVDIQCGPHLVIVTHESSEVNWTEPCPSPDRQRIASCGFHSA